MQGRDFSYLTVAAVAASIVFFSVIVMGESREGQRNGYRNGCQEAVGSIRSENSPWTVEASEAVHNETGGVGTPMGAISEVQPCVGLSGAGRGVDTRRGSTTQRQAVQVEVSARRLFDAIRQVESAGNDLACGDGGRSLGPYQMGLAAWLDSGGVAAAYRGAAFNRASTEAAMLRYWKRYGCVTDEAKARCWVAGPRWRTRALGAGDRYWGRVKEAMQ